MASTSWLESDFEKWLKDNQSLFLGKQREKFLIISQHGVGRMVDLVALDQCGRIVVIEVKNEKSGRSAIGQSLEYLATYHKVSLEELAGVYADFCSRQGKPGTLREDYERQFNAALSLSDKRRVLVVAPSFDFAAIASVSYLNSRFKEGIAVVDFELVTAVQKGSDFQTAHEKRDVVKPQNLAGGQFVESGYKSLYYILKGGAPPVCWKIGKLRSGAAVDLAEKTTSIWMRNSPVVPFSKSNPWVDVSDSGSVWQKKTDATVRARLLGVVTGMDGRKVVCAELRGNLTSAPELRIRVRDYDEFHDTRRRIAEGDFPTWLQIARKLHGK